jgi:hypothetical protein
VLLLATRRLAGWLGPDAMGTVRLAAILLLALYGFLAFRVLDRHLGDPRAAFAAVVALLTLPAFQLYVAAAPWLTVALLLSTLAFLVARRALEGGTASRRARLIALLAAVAGLGLSLGVYQAVAQVYVAFVLLAYLFEPRPADKATVVRYAGYAGLWAASLLAYWILWGLVFRYFFPTLIENRYSPGNLASNPIEKLTSFFGPRLAQVFNLWDVASGGNARSIVWYGVAALLIAGFTADARRRLRERGFAGLAEIGFRAAAVLLAWIASDTAVLASRTTINTYTTAAALSQAVFFTLLWAIVAILAVIPGRMPRGLAGISFLAATIGGIAAQSSVLRYFTTPLAREAVLVRAEILAATEEGQAPDPIIVRVVDKAATERAYAEYGWNNLNHEFYVDWFVRNQLWQLGLDQQVTIIAIDRTGNRLPPMQVGPRRKVGARPVCIDLRPILAGIGRLPGAVPDPSSLPGRNRDCGAATNDRR